MSDWLSDAFCRLSTGGGFSIRALYTDSAEKIFEGARPVLLNGIDVGIDRGDLVDRAIRLELPPIPEERRETEKKLWERFEASRPSILGSLMDAVACALRRSPGIEVPKLPRMADFAAWVCAAEPALGLEEGSFLEEYRQNRRDSNSLALEASVLFPLIAQSAERGMWQGTATELLEVLRMESLTATVSDTTSFPKSARELSQAMRRLAPNLLQAGITVEFHKTPGDNSRRMISIRKSDVALLAFIGQLQVASGLSPLQFKRRIDRVSALIDRIYATGQHDRVFKGSWYGGFLSLDLKSAAGGRAYNANGIEERVKTAALAKLDFTQPWAGYFTNSVSSLAHALQQMI